MNNDSLMDRLKVWSRERAQIDPDSFDCRFYAECNASIHERLQGGSGCQMSYVGCGYGANTDSFRLVIVGMDSGEGEDKVGKDFDAARMSIEGWYQKDGCPFNPHYQGVVKTAAAIFGSSGQNCARLCDKSCQKSNIGAIDCVIDRIAQPNLVKCTPKDQKSRQSESTRNMKANCVNHLIAELQILKPNLTVFHGIEARSIVLPAFKTLYSDEPIPLGKVRDGRGPVLWKTPQTYLLFLYHPTYGWLNGEWNDVVEPCLKYLRDENLIPV
jgi:hypothetical protein